MFAVLLQQLGQHGQPRIRFLFAAAGSLVQVRAANRAQAPAVFRTKYFCIHIEDECRAGQILRVHFPDLEEHLLAQGNCPVKKLNSRKAYTIVFLIYLIPGLPKDIMSYAAGISSMNFKAFLIFSMIGRTPAMSGSLLIGTLYFSGHYAAMIAIGAFAVVAFILCIVFRKKISNYIDKLYEKVTED